MEKHHQVEFGGNVTAVNFNSEIDLSFTIKINNNNNNNNKNNNNSNRTTLYVNIKDLYKSNCGLFVNGKGMNMTDTTITHRQLSELPTIFNSGDYRRLYSKKKRYIKLPALFK